jgi:hypothetical protein
MRLLDDHFVTHHAAMIEADLRNATPGDRAWMFEDSEIKALLRRVARLRRVRDLAAASGRERVSVWRRFKRRWGRSPSEILSLFRVLWASHLRREGFANSEIARLLGFQDVHHCSRRIGARLGLPKSILNRLPYSEVVAAVVACLARGTPARALVSRATAALRQSARLSGVIITALGSALSGVVGTLRECEVLALLEEDSAVVCTVEASAGHARAGRRRSFPGARH